MLHDVRRAFQRTASEWLRCWEGELCNGGEGPHLTVAFELSVEGELSNVELVRVEGEASAELTSCLLERVRSTRVAMRVPGGDGPWLVRNTFAPDLVLC